MVISNKQSRRWPNTGNYCKVLPEKGRNLPFDSIKKQVSMVGAGGGTRTHTPSLATDFEFYKNFGGTRHQVEDSRTYCP